MYVQKTRKKADVQAELALKMNTESYKRGKLFTSIVRLSVLQLLELNNLNSPPMEKSVKSGNS